MLIDLVIWPLIWALPLLILGILHGPILRESPPEARAEGPAIADPARLRSVLATAPCLPLFVVGPAIVPSWAEGLPSTCVYCSPAGLAEADDSGRDPVFRGDIRDHHAIDANL
jgi:hypothetical protein